MKASDYVDIFTSTGAFLQPYSHSQSIMGSTTGRWNTPTKNKAHFMASSPVSSCCQVSGGKDWDNRGDDITTMVERLEKHKKLFTNNKVESTVSSPPNMWTHSCSSSTNSHQNCLSLNSGYNSQSFNRSGHTSYIIGGNTSFSSNNQSTFGSRTHQCGKELRDSFNKPDRFSINSSYENDRLMAMD